MASTSPTTNVPKNASGHCQPGETCAREAAMLGSQGTTSVHGTWCSEGEAGRHLRTKAGQAGTTPVGPGTPSPSRGDWNGSQLRHNSIPTWRLPRSPTTWIGRCWNGLLGALTQEVPLGWTGSHGRRTRPTWKHTWWHYTRNSSTERTVRNRLFAA